MLIVNADDFGICSQVNAAILACFQAEIISSTTIMPTMPAFEAACQLAHEHKLLHRVGIHLNITAGIPLTDAIKASRKFCNADGLFAFKRERCLYLSAAEREVLAGEIAAQIARCHSQGLPLTHADTHHHSHTEIPVFRVMAPILRQHNIHSVRLTRNIGAMSWLRRTYKASYNSWLKRLGFWTTDYFGSLSDGPIIQQYAHDNKHILEIMLHPGYNRKGELIDILGSFKLPQAISSLLAGSLLVPYPLIQKDER